MQEMGKDTEQRLNEIAKRNLLGMGVMGACLAAMVFINRAVVHKFERNNAKLSQARSRMKG